MLNKPLDRYLSMHMMQEGIARTESRRVLVTVEGSAGVVPVMPEPVLLFCFPPVESGGVRLIVVKKGGTEVRSDWILCANRSTTGVVSAARTSGDSSPSSGAMRSAHSLATLGGGGGDEVAPCSSSGTNASSPLFFSSRPSSRTACQT